MQSRTASPAPRRKTQSSQARSTAKNSQAKHNHPKTNGTSTPSKLKAHVSASKRSKPQRTPEGANTQVFTCVIGMER